ncbi:F390 synthetase-related protein [Escherichia fergusonii]|uniref:F390 synthetase-related protein n=1 Tax=Escherichia fergusonii TaxID=564 RepID=UPI0015E4EC54|nr:F390 synthetase-related protein [Escherichia fergusonii]EHG6152745.1 CoF synthetase [Escherichia fergusonii]EHG6211778.1 CoF synthetase [Escherichia fergusonii]QLM89822.1 CoF synthetase [Escherichia fergusonii]QMH67223.1 CoF synthetase [Escherichia fergusonii]QML46424.1 CoF synthetase [Escherichia fergusonii]
MIPLAFLWRYFRTRRLHFTDRQVLENWQAKRLHQFRQNVLSKSPWFQRYLALPFNQWPLMDKALMMAHFDEMNTAGLKRDELLACAMRSEQSRDFKPCVGKFSVGLSSGTSGRRGLFVVSPHEQQMWAAGVLAKVLPDGLFAKERVALFLRADNNLYQSVNNRWLSLDFYDLLAPFQAQLKLLQQRAPTIIVAPAQVLRALALAVMAGELTLKVKKVISVAEVLEPQDRELLRSVFSNVGEIYQATEGFLASTCRCGTLHLNEEFVHIEPQWLDERRFVPIVTDFTRTTQPVVRYRLDDVLVASEQPCPCGSAAMAIARIEGRQDDQLQLPTRTGGIQTVFADACSRVLAMTLPLTADYRLLQTGPAQLTLIVDCKWEMLALCREALNALFMRQNIAVGQLIWSLESQTVPVAFTAKRRRIVRQWGRE